VDELISRGPKEIWITTDMPNYFRPMGFVESNEIPDSIAKKLERFRDFGRGQIVAMRRVKSS
jgi:hypothetical protein